MRNIIKHILKEEYDSRYDRIKSIVNKYGIDRAIELVVGGMDTIRIVYEDNPETFLDQFNDLTILKIDNKIYYVDKNGSPLFYYFTNKKNGDVYINYYRIWMFFSDVLELKYSETQDIIKKWLEVNYNLKGLTPTSTVARDI